MRFRIEFDNGQKKFLYEDTNIHFKENLELAVDNFLKMVNAPSSNSSPTSVSYSFNTNQYGHYNIIPPNASGNNPFNNNSIIQIQDLFSDTATTWEPITEVQPGDSITLEDMIK
ncbi:MAG: hypothetical protein EBU90_27600 [Proteobacteria bacterium]|nr:hypothetical protein [Pseudomonadota bacterium]